MSARRANPEERLLFDLPLRPPEEKEEEPVEEGKEPRSRDSRRRQTPLPEEEAREERPASPLPPRTARQPAPPTRDPASGRGEEPLRPEAPEGAVPPRPLELRPAPVSLRLLAGLSDLGVNLAALVVVLVGILVMGVQPALSSWPAALLFLAVFSFLYHTVPLAFWGQTPGMAAHGLTARSRRDETLTFLQVSLRWIGGVVTLALAGLPLLLALTGRSLTDRVSGSRTWYRE